MLTGVLPSLPFESMHLCTLFDYQPPRSYTNKLDCPFPAGAVGKCQQYFGEGNKLMPIDGSECKFNECTGSSQLLAPDQCDAWIDLYDATGGESWLACASLRTDPCSCTAHRSAPSTCNYDGTTVTSM